MNLSILNKKIHCGAKNCLFYDALHTRLYTTERAGAPCSLVSPVSTTRE